MKVPESPPPLRRYTSPTGRIVIPVLAVVLLIVILGRPILISGLDLDEEPEPVPTERPDRGNGNEDPGPSRLESPVPNACLDDARDSGAGLIAAFDGGAVTARTPSGGVAFALRARPPIGFSASGRYLATAGADLWTSRGGHIGTAFARPAMKWAWSPLGDCIAGIDKGRLVIAEPDEKAVVLLGDMGVETFSFSPDGTRLVVAVGGSGPKAGIWMADLQTREVKPLQPSPEGWSLTGWSRAVRPILLKEVAEGGSRESLSFPPSDQVSYCGDEVITIRRERLATFGVSGLPKYVPADRRFRYAAVACAPSSDLLVTIRYPKGNSGKTEVAVLRRDGTFVEELGQQSSVEDGPMWGPRGTGVVFAGTVGGEGSVGPLVWFVPEGGSARPTGLRVDKLGDELDAWLDWSATPPLGHPTD